MIKEALIHDLCFEICVYKTQNILFNVLSIFIGLILIFLLYHLHLKSPW